MWCEKATIGDEMIRIVEISHRKDAYKRTSSLPREKVMSGPKKCLNESKKYEWTERFEWIEMS